MNTNAEAASRVLLSKMVSAIAHRGVNYERVYVDKYVGLGHRGESVFKRSSLDDQPMQTPDSRYIITFDGEIYNFRELKAELESFGYNFRSSSDCEVVLYAYMHWGESCLNKFNGAFGLAVWDSLDEKMFCARDRYGIKPFYYYFDGSRLIFASEQKAILADTSVKREICFEALVEYFTFQNILTDATFFKNIKILPAGSFFCIKKGSPFSIKIKRYWDYSFSEPEIPLTEEEYIEQGRFLFNQAVNRQLIGDAEIGAYLSGGIDSGAITTVAAKQIPYIKTFTCGFDMHSASGLELGYDEREKAEHMSYLLKTEHYEMVLKAGDMERVMPRLSYHIEEPRIGQSYPNYYVSQLASKFVNVVLSGAGGDELFGGYPWRYYKAAANTGFDNYIDKYYAFWQRLIPDKDIKGLFKPVYNQVSHVRTRDIFKSVFQKPESVIISPEEYINHSLYFEAKTFLHGLLVIEDKISMSHGLVVRSPFLDNDLVEFAMSVPVKYKLKNLVEAIRTNENEPGNKPDRYYQRTMDGKLLLRKIMSKNMPEVITNGYKQGFSAPDGSWFKGESIDYVKRILYDDKAMLYNFFDKKTLHRLTGEHFDGSQNRRLFIWSLLNFEWWARNYL